MLSVAKTKKNQRFYALLLKSFLFAALLFVIAFQLKNENWESLGSTQIKHPFSLLLSVLLVYVNQWCEWKKWKVSAKKLIGSRSELRSAFFSGIGTGFLTPNGWGNFLGRMAYVRRRDRYFIILATFLSNVSQVLPTLLFGAIAVLFSDKLPSQAAWFAFAGWTIVCALFLFEEHLLPLNKSRFRLMRRIRIMKEQAGTIRFHLFMWSNLRFLVFSAQYLLLFHALGHTDLWPVLTGVWLIFLLTSFVPSLWSGKILIRETAAVFVFSGTAVPVSDAILVCLFIWLMNVVLPVLVSAFGTFSMSKKARHVVD